MIFAKSAYETKSTKLLTIVTKVEGHLYDEAISDEVIRRILPQKIAIVLLQILTFGILCLEKPGGLIGGQYTASPTQDPCWHFSSLNPVLRVSAIAVELKLKFILD